MDTKEKAYSAIQIDRLLTKTNRGMRPYRCDPDLKDLLNRIVSLYQTIEPTNDMGTVSLWFFVPRGKEDVERNLSAFENEPQNEDKCDALWNPDELSWYQVAVTQCYGSQIIGINQHVFYFKDTGKVASNPYVKELLEWFYQETLHVLAMVKEGTYTDFVGQNLPYEFRAGTLSRNEYNEICPGEGIPLTKAQIAEFLAYTKDADGMKAPKEPLSDLTIQKLNDLLQDVLLGEEAEHIAHKKVCNGFAEGLETIDPKSQNAFCSWLKTQMSRGQCVPVYTLYEEHFLDSIDLSLCGENEYYFELSGASERCWVDTIRFYLAFCRRGVPITLFESDLLRKRVTGEEIIGFVPRGIDVTTFHVCEPYFRGRTVDTYLELDFDPKTKQKLIERIHWIPIQAIGQKDL